MQEMADAQGERAGTAGGHGAAERLLAYQRRVDAHFPLWFKLTVPMLIIGLVGALILMVMIYGSEADRTRADFASKASLITHDIEGQIALDGGQAAAAPSVPDVQAHIDYLVAAEPEIIRIDVLKFGNDPRIVASSDHARIQMAADDEPPEEASPNAEVRLPAQDIDVYGRHALESFVPLRTTDGTIMATAVYLSTAGRDAHLAALLRSLLGGAGLTIVIALALLVLSIRLLVLDRAHMLLRATMRMESGDFGVRIPDLPEQPARDEMIELARRFNHTVASVQELHAQLAVAATTDQLTGLYNRRYLIETLDREIARAHRLRQPLALVMADLDGLKQVNDRLGHVAGDTAICLAGEGIKAALRAGDYAARIGGDEFVAVLPGCSHDDLRMVLERLHTAASERVSAAGLPGQPRTTVSTGGAVLRPDDDVTSLLQRADDAMYEAKRAGKNESRIAA